MKVRTLIVTTLIASLAGPAAASNRNETASLALDLNLRQPDTASQWNEVDRRNFRVATPATSLSAWDDTGIQPTISQQPGITYSPETGKPVFSNAVKYEADHVLPHPFQLRLPLKRGAD